MSQMCTIVMVTNDRVKAGIKIRNRIYDRARMPSKARGGLGPLSPALLAPLLGHAIVSGVCPAQIPCMPRLMAQDGFTRAI